jgi:hypothetical protein
MGPCELMSFFGLGRQSYTIQLWGTRIVFPGNELN